MRYLFVCGLIFGMTLQEIVHELGGPLVKTEMPVWADVLICITALSAAFLIILRTGQ